MTTDTETEAEAARRPYRLDGDQLEATRAKIEKINRRAAKRALGGRLTIDVTEVQVEETDPLTHFTTTRTMYDTVLGGEAPAYNGWSFIATLDWDEYAGLVVRAVPGAPAIERDNLKEGWCDHCKTVRRRNNTYVVREQATGAQLQIGSSCIKDFLGWTGSIAWLDAPNADDDDEGMGWFGSAGRPDYAPLTVLAYAWAVIKLHGWVPASSFGTTTKGLVLTALYPNVRIPGEREFAATLAPLAAEAATRAQEILAFILSDAFDGKGDYVTNLKAVAAGRRVSQHNFGLIVSAPQAYAKHQEQTLIRAREAAAPSEWVGKVGARSLWTVTVTGIRYIAGDYGTTTLYTLADEAGNTLKWFASRDLLGEDTGATFVIKATVKTHDQFKGTKQTVLTRAAVVEELAPVAA